MKDNLKYINYFIIIILNTNTKLDIIPQTEHELLDVVSVVVGERQLQTILSGRPHLRILSLSLVDLHNSSVPIFAQYTIHTIPYN